MVPKSSTPSSENSDVDQCRFDTTGFRSSESLGVFHGQHVSLCLNGAKIADTELAAIDSRDSGVLV